jgi:hypothetical protein
LDFFSQFYWVNITHRKQAAKPTRNRIPAQLNNLSQNLGLYSGPIYLPVTNLKFTIAITGAIRKLIVIAKSTKDFRCFPKKKTSAKEPMAILSIEME